MARGRVLDAVVGGSESVGVPAAEQDHRRRLARKGVETRYEAISGMNHFTVCDPMTDPGSAMTKRLVELAKGLTVT